MADKEVRIRVKADIEPNIVQPRVTVQTGGGDERFNIPRFSGQTGSNIKTPTPPPRNFEEERYNRIRSHANEDLRSLIVESSRYTTSSREMERFINERVKRASSSAELDYSRQVVGVGERLKAGTISNREATEQLRLAKEQYNEDKLQTKILKDTLETIKSTSREEIRENAKAVQDRLATSRNVGRLGIEGDEYKAFSEKFQSDELQTEKILQKFNLGRYANAAFSGGRSIVGGDLAGLAMMGSRSALGAMGGVGLAGGAALGAGAGVLALIAGAFMSNKKVAEKTRPFLLSTQYGVGDIKNLYNTFQTGDFNEIGMTPFEGMDFYGNLARASGGGNFSINQARGYAGLTRSREVSPELLNQTIGFSRYSNGGSAMGVVNAFEQALSKKFGSGDEFKRKLVQLPEMMGVYNTLAQQMLQNTGRFNSNNLSNFVSGVGTAFGVEGVNLQRYATGITGMFSRSDNPFISKFQYAALRDINPDITRQQALEILEKPTDNPDYMRAMYRRMRGTNDMNIFRSWTQQMGGFGAAESRQMYESKSFEEFFSLIKQKQGNKTTPEANYDKYFESAQNFYAASEKQTALVSEAINDLKTWLGEKYEDVTSSGVKNGVQQVIIENGGFLPTRQDSLRR